MTITTPSIESHHDPTTPFKVVNQFGILVMENYVLSYNDIFKGQPIQQKKLVMLLLMQMVLLDVQHS